MPYSDTNTIQIKANEDLKAERGVKFVTGPEEFPVPCVYAGEGDDLDAVTLEPIPSGEYGTAKLINAPGTLPMTAGATSVQFNIEVGLTNDGLVIDNPVGDVIGKSMTDAAAVGAPVTVRPK